MKIIIEEQNRKVSVEHTTDGMTVSQVVENLFRPAMLGMGYQEGSLNKTIGFQNDDSLITEYDYE
jgi:hypothetical protein